MVKYGLLLSLFVSSGLCIEAGLELYFQQHADINLKKIEDFHKEYPNQESQSDAELKSRLDALMVEKAQLEKVIIDNKVYEIFRAYQTLAYFQQEFEKESAKESADEKKREELVQSIKNNTEKVDKLIASTPLDKDTLEQRLQDEIRVHKNALVIIAGCRSSSK